MNEQQAKKLREPFKPAQIGKLPKPTRRENPKGKCGECGGYHGLPAVHLDYVGHAAITDRLLEVDPAWSWEPMAVGPNGEPLFTNGGLWIKLTICGVTRPGFGDETNGKGTKEVIGDALRNAAMRFGVGLDLWSKEDLLAKDDGEPSSAGEPKATASRSVSQAAKAKPASPAEGTQTQFVAPTGGPSDAQKKLLEVLFTKLPKANLITATEMTRIAATAAGADPEKTAWSEAVALLKKPQASQLISHFKDIETQGQPAAAGK